MEIYGHLDMYLKHQNLSTSNNFIDSVEWYLVLNVGHQEGSATACK